MTSVDASNLSFYISQISGQPLIASLPEKESHPGQQTLMMESVVMTVFEITPSVPFGQTPGIGAQMIHVFQEEMTSHLHGVQNEDNVLITGLSEPASGLTMSEML